MSDKVHYYQSIPQLGIVGRMNTPEEFDKIGLPKEMPGWEVLDVGCNIGAFLIESFNRGADECYGIEPDVDWRIIAQGIRSELSYGGHFVIVESFEKFEEGFEDLLDLALLLSVTHLVKDPQKLIDKTWKYVKDSGLMIVEVNDRLQTEPIKLPGKPVLFGKNKDNRSVWHIRK